MQADGYKGGARLLVREVGHVHVQEYPYPMTGEIGPTFEE